MEVWRKLTCCVPKASAYSKRQWATLIVFGLAYLFSACVTSLQAPFYPAEAERKGASATEYGMVFGVFQFAMFLISPVYGKYMNKLGAKTVFNVGILASGISCFSFGFLDDVNDHTWFITLSFIIRILEALGSAAFVTSAFTIVAAEFPDSVATTFASLETFYGLGAIIGPSIGGALYEIGGFTAPFAITGLCLVTVALITPFLMPKNGLSEGGDAKDREGFGLISLLKIPAAAIAGISIWMSSNSIGFLNATLEPHLRQFQLSELQVGLVWAGAGAAYCLSAPLWGKWMDKTIHPKYVAFYGTILIIIAHFAIGPAVFFPFQTNFEVTCTGLVIHGLGVGAIQVSGFVLALRESIANGFPDDLATYSVVSGLWASALSLGLFVGPTLGGIFLDQTNYRVASLFPLITAILNMLLVIMFIMWDRNKQKEIFRAVNLDLESAQLTKFQGTIPKSRPQRVSQEFRGDFVYPSYGSANE